MKRFALLLFALATLAAPAASADPGGRGRDFKPDLGSRWSPDQARDAVREGRHRPLQGIFGDLHNRFGGRQVDAELISQGPRAHYRIRWMTGDGRLLDLIVDAESGAIMR